MLIKYEIERKAIDVGKIKDESDTTFFCNVNMAVFICMYVYFTYVCI